MESEGANDEKMSVIPMYSSGEVKAQIHIFSLMMMYVVALPAISHTTDRTAIDYLAMFVTNNHVLKRLIHHI